MLSDEEHLDSEFYYPEEQETAERKASRRGWNFNQLKLNQAEIPAWKFSSGCSDFRPRLHANVIRLKFSNWINWRVRSYRSQSGSGYWTRQLNIAMIHDNRDVWLTFTTCNFIMRQSLVFTTCKHGNCWVFYCFLFCFCLSFDNNTYTERKITIWDTIC